MGQQQSWKSYDHTIAGGAQVGSGNEAQFPSSDK